MVNIEEKEFDDAMDYVRLNCDSEIGKRIDNYVAYLIGELTDKNSKINRLQKLIHT